MRCYYLYSVECLPTKTQKSHVFQHLKSRKAQIFLTQFVNFLVGGIPWIAALELQHTGRKA